MLFCILVGFGLAKAGAPFDNKVIGSLVSNVGYPTLILSHLAAKHVSLGALLNFMLAALTAVGCFCLIGFLFLRLVRLSPRAYLSPLMFNNVGNIGLSVSMLAFGPQGLAYAIAFVIVVLVGIFTVAIWLPKGEFSIRELVNKPTIYAVGLAIVLMATGTNLPPTIDKSFGILGGIAIPLMLLTLGHTLATLQVGAVWRGCYLAVFHLCMGVCVGLALAAVFDLSGTARGVFILGCIMPSAVGTYLWVDRYYPEEASGVASLIFVSTLLSAVSLPLALTVLA